MNFGRKTMKAVLWGVLGLLGFGASSCKYQDSETGPEDRTIVTAIPEPYKRTTPVVGRLDRSVDSEDGAGTPRVGVIEGRLHSSGAKDTLEVVSGGQTVKLVVDEGTKTAQGVEEGAQVRASYEVVGEEKLARDVQPVREAK
jgi:hypothetical protein